MADQTIVNRVAATLTAILLAGCAGQSLPPGTPSPTDIQTIRQQIAADDTPPGDYLIYGTTLAARNCIGWFSTQIAAAQQTSALSGGLGTLIGVAGAAGGPYGAGAAAGMGALTSLLNNSQQNAPAGIDPVATYGLVRKVTQAWLSMAPTPASKAEAFMLVEDFAEKCQLPEIRSAIVAAVMTAPVRAMPMSAAATFGFAPEARGRVMPPAIVIGEH